MKDIPDDKMVKMRRFSKDAFDDIALFEFDIQDRRRESKSQRTQSLSAQDDADGLHMEGRILDWPQTLSYSKFVQEQGLQELIWIYDNSKDRKDDPFRWGDEIEYTLLKDNKKAGIMQLPLRGQEYLKKLMKVPNSICHWFPESGEFNLETSPMAPYENDIASWLNMEKDLDSRVKEGNSILPKNEHLLTYCAFGRGGCPRATDPEYIITDPETTNPIEKSDFCSDKCISSFERYQAFANNTRQRRDGAKNIINVPVFIDKNTKRPFRQPGMISEESKSAALDDHIYMDWRVGHATSNQVTMQASCLDECVELFDQCVALTPILAALSAASPVFHGVLADTDGRMLVYEQALDDRTLEERKDPISMRRCSPVHSYLGNHHGQFNDVKFPINEKYERILIEHGVDAPQAKHFAFLFNHDPIVLYDDKINMRLEDGTLFQNINSSVWQSLRFKPPDLESECYWRVEFRPISVQPTSFEMTALSLFTVVMARAFLKYKVDMVIPMSQVHENMKRGDKRDAVIAEKFFFRLNEGGEVGEYSIDQIVNGTETASGLLHYARKYIKEMAPEVYDDFNKYFIYVSMRASGKIPTPAKDMRQFIMNHPDYAHDSIVTDSIQYDLVQALFLKNPDVA